MRYQNIVYSFFCTTNIQFCFSMTILLNLSKLRIRQKKHETRITKLQHVRLIVNKRLLVRVIYANKIGNIRFNLHISIEVKH